MEMAMAIIGMRKRVAITNLIQCKLQFRIGVRATP